jgi:hypothetical protein
VFDDEPMRELEQLRRGEWQAATPTPKVRPEQGERIALSDEEATHLVSMTFRSRSENAQPHVVTVGYDDIPRCICRATHPCWGVKAFCAVTGRPTP